MSSHEPGTVFFERYRHRRWWTACWIDHAGREIHVRLGLETEMGNVEARRRARRAVDQYMLDHERRLAEKHAMTQDEIEAMAQTASFPREVVAKHVDAIIRRIAKAEQIDDYPARQLFSDRSTISLREVTRILTDPTRIKVSLDVVDRIVCNFRYFLLIDDFIVDAHAWANKTEGSEWEKRYGTEDAWPVGYARIIEDDDIL